MFENNFEIQEAVVSRANQDGTVIIMKMDEGNTFFKINGVAAEVWKDLSNKKEINEILIEIKKTYNAPGDQIESDVQDFLDKLLLKDLIKKI